MLAQHGIPDMDIAGAMTDAGSDVRKGAALAWRLEWCIARLLNRATIDGTGMSLAGDRSKNLPYRKLLKLFKKMVEHFKKSAVDKVRRGRFSRTI